MTVLALLLAAFSFVSGPTAADGGFEDCERIVDASFLAKCRSAHPDMDALWPGARATGGLPSGWVIGGGHGS